MIRLERVSKIYPTGEVLNEVTWEINLGQRIGLVGVNGSGKSTQLKIIAGLEEPSSGEVIRKGNPSIGYLSQEFDFDFKRTLRQELFQAFSEASLVLNRKSEVEKLLESDKALIDSKYFDALINELGFLQSRFEALNGYELEAKIDKLLPKIGFNSTDADTLLDSFSGGWQMRIGIGKIMLKQPDLLLLDEPTNHLDIQTIEWLESYLLNQQSAMVVISHDRRFLDKLCTNIVNTERGKSRSYIGNYSSYIQQRKLEEESSISAFERQQKYLNEQKSYIDRFRASATRSTQAKSREKLISKVEVIEPLPITLNKPKFSFPEAPRSGREVAKIKDLSLAYQENILFLEANLEIEKGDHIAILGPNGSGKSTLLRLLMGIEKPEEGTISLGSHNIIPSYFEQNQSEALDLDKNVLDTLFNKVPDWTQSKVRSLLGGLGFSNEDVFKSVCNLSGGEKARLALALIIVRPCNFLLLDEPTNHLDIPAKEMLEGALREYNGTLLFISHDRYFISKIANRIVEIKDGQLLFYNGDYSYYLDKKEQERILQEQELALAKREEKRLANRNRKKKRK